MKKREEESILSIWWSNYSETYWTICVVVTMMFIFLPKLELEEQVMRVIGYFYSITILFVLAKCSIKQVCGIGRKNVIEVKWYYVIIGLLSFVIQSILLLSSAVLAVRVLMKVIGLI